MNELLSFAGRGIAAAALTIVIGSHAAHAAVTVGDLRCEYLDNPQGIDVRQPRLSWILASDERGQRQTAYQVLAASTPEKLAADDGDLWDSGRVESDASIHVRYEGQALPTHAPCYWKVRVWDKAGAESAWSQPAHWTMGVLEPGDWQAKWIGLEGDGSPKFLADTNWIWFPEGTPQTAVPSETRYFRRSFSVPADRVVTKATLLITADNRCTIWLNGGEIGSRSGHDSAQEFDLTHRLAQGENLLAISVTNDPPGDNPAGLAAKLQVEFAAGEPLTLATDSQWKTANAEAADWTKSDFDDSSWETARVLGPVGMPPWGRVRRADDRRLPARYVRKEFTLDKEVKRAIVSFSGLGSSELYLNGEKVGDHVLSPAGTQYPKRVIYVTHDVTEQLQRGENAIGVLLGNGRYYSPRSEDFLSMPHYGYPKLLLHLRVEHPDGTTTTVVSDESWKLTDNGPIRANNEYDGEEYDVNLELGAWTKPSYDDGKRWQQAQAAIVPTGEVRAQMQEPIRVTETLKPMSVTERSPSVFVVDMGQNLVGWCRIRVPHPFGVEVKLIHAETLQPDGSLYLANIRGALVTDIYRGPSTDQGPPEGLAQVDQWEPRFTYHGFRYVEVTGWPGKLTVDDIDGRVVHDDLRTAGKFDSSNALLNRIYQNVVWGTRGNYRSFPTDCPQRDERQGWLGDRGEISRGEMYIYDNAAFYAKWAQDIADSTKDSGSLSDVCPAHWPFYTDNVTWPSTTVLLPNSLYRQFADADIVARHYDSAKRWIDYMLTFVKDGLIDRDQYGDWCVPPEDPKLIHSQDPARQTNKTLLATSYLYYDLSIMERFARMLGKDADAADFAKRAEELKTAFNAKFLDRERGQYDNGSQTSCVLPLRFGLVPDDMRDRVFARLVDKITKETNNHIGTGLIGGQYLNRVLAEGGRSDLAYTIATQEDYPSWGYMIANDATTIWELWNGNTADPAMNSHNHVMLVGDYVLWLYEHLAGIRPDDERPGFKHIVMRPEPVPGLDWVDASYRSPYGLIKSRWERKDGKFVWDVSIPVGAEATVYVPATDHVRESGELIGDDGDTPGLQSIGSQNGRSIFILGSGEYHFESQ